MNRTEAVALSLLQAGTEPDTRSHQHVFHELPHEQLIEAVRKWAPARMEEAERFLVLLHERGWKVVEA